MGEAAGSGKVSVHASHDALELYSPAAPNSLSSLNQFQGTDPSFQVYVDASNSPPPLGILL